MPRRKRKDPWFDWFLGDRHGGNWWKASISTKQASGYRCCLCGKRATVSHHAYYGLSLRWLSALIFIGLPSMLKTDPMIALLLIPVAIAGLFFKLPISGLEVPGWQTFALCNHHHSNGAGCAHHLKNYYARGSKWTHHNTWFFTQRLRIGFMVNQLRFK